MQECKLATNPISKSITDEGSEELRDITLYRGAVGSLAFLADTTRPDIAYAVNQLAREMRDPSTAYRQRVEQVLGYLGGTSDLCIMFNITKIVLKAYSDSDLAAHSGGKSTTGWVILCNEAPFHWKTQLQRHTTLSSTEGEVVSMCALAKEVVWIR